MNEVENVYRRLDYLMANRRPMPRPRAQAIFTGSSVGPVSAQAVRALDDPGWWSSERFRLHREAAERDARLRQNGGR